MDERNKNFLNACEEGHLETVKLMVSKGINNLEYGMIRACWSGQFGIIKFLIDKAYIYSYYFCFYQKRFVKSLTLSELSKYQSILEMNDELREIIRQQFRRVFFVRLCSFANENMFPVLKSFVK